MTRKAEKQEDKTKTIPIPNYMLKWHYLFLRHKVKNNEIKKAKKSQKCEIKSQTIKDICKSDPEIIFFAQFNFVKRHMNLGNSWATGNMY